MHDDRIEHEGRREDEPPAEGERTAGRGRGPAAGLVADGEAPGLHPQLRRPRCDAFGDDLTGPPAQPRLEQLGRVAAVATEPDDEPAGHDLDPPTGRPAGWHVHLGDAARHAGDLEHDAPLPATGRAARRLRSLVGARETWRSSQAACWTTSRSASARGMRRGRTTTTSPSRLTVSRARRARSERRTVYGCRGAVTSAASAARRRRGTPRRPRRSMDTPAILGCPGAGPSATAYRQPAALRFATMWPRGDSSAGRASAWHAEGPGFESPSLHHPTRNRGPLSDDGGLVVTGP